jgi:ABC-type Fe3+ transport system permease subunit
MPNRQWGSRAGGAARATAPRRRRRLLTRVLLWILALLVVFVLLALLFGGFQKGQKAGLGSDPGRGFRSVASTESAGPLPAPCARWSTAS